MKLLKTKTFWTGVATVVAGGFLIAGGQKEKGVLTILGGLSVIFLREGIRKG